jgi:hypothetical protein
MGEAATLEFVANRQFSALDHPGVAGQPSSAASTAPLALSSDLFHFEKRSRGGLIRREHYAEHGSAEEAAANRAKRLALANSPSIARAAVRFWSTAGLSDEDSMDRETYVTIFQNIARTIGVTTAANGEGRARELALQDWANDLESAAPFEKGAGTAPKRRLSHSHGRMSKEAFVSGLFELADTWTEGCSELEYCLFLSKVYR